MMQEFVQQIHETIKKDMNGMHTVTPGEIVSYDASSGLATVLPKMKYKQPNGKTLDYPQISEVPVVFLQTMNQEATIGMPIKEGDGCLILFAEQSIDYWLHGQETDTDLRFDLTNAVCIPGLFTKANDIVKEACENNAIIVDLKGSRVTVKKDKIMLKSQNIEIEGDVKVKGDITTEGDISNTGNIISSSDVKAGSVSLKLHTHNCTAPGSPSGPAIGI